jgi:hypothetical protein
MRYKLISCEVFTRELCACLARSPHTIDVEFLPKGLHDYGGERMLKPIQALVDRAEGLGYDAVLIGYGLCNNGVAGLAARSIPVVLPRAHDCIAIFFGSRKRYQDYFDEHPGTYFKTTGWIERSNPTDDQNQLSMERAIKAKISYPELVEKYGEENAAYLVEQLSGSRHYRRMTFIEMGVEPGQSYEEGVRTDAAGRGWDFEKVRGDMSILQRLVDGQWAGDDFLRLAPGEKVVARYDEGIVAAEKGERL